MSFVELLFIAAFILLPIMEGILKQRQKRQGRPGARPGGPGRPDPGTSSERQEARSAAEMLPDDLWELMTGEQRNSGGDGPGGGDDPWSGEPGVATETAQPGAPTEEPWATGEEVEREAPVSAEYTGPEAYSLETPAPPPLERTVPTAAARHSAFHAMIERTRRPTKRHHLSPLMAALRSPDGLRQAVLLQEILGPPKGME